MADTDVVVKDSAGADRKVDTRTVGAGTDEHRQVVAVGDPAAAAGVAAVLNANPAAAEYAIVARAIPQRATTGAGTSVAGSATSVALLASNAARLGYRVWNDSTAALHVGEGFTPSTAGGASGHFSYKLAPGAFYESPAGAPFSGAVNGVWTAANGYARMTELT